MLILYQTYPAQTYGTSAEYPYGSPKNKASAADQTGFPLERLWICDLYGGFYSVLIAGGVTPSGNADEYGASDFLTALQAVAISTLAGDNTSYTGNPTYSGTVTFAAATVAFSGAGTLTIGSSTTVTINAIPTLSNGASLAGGVLACSGAGHLRKRVFWVVADDNISKGITDCDSIVIPGAAAWTGSHNCTLSVTGATDGVEMTVTNLHITHSVIVGGWELKAATGYWFEATFVYNADAAAWWLKSASPYDP